MDKRQKLFFKKTDLASKLTLFSLAISEAVYSTSCVNCVFIPSHLTIKMGKCGKSHCLFFYSAINAHCTEQ